MDAQGSEMVRRGLPVSVGITNFQMDHLEPLLSGRIASSTVPTHGLVSGHTSGLGITPFNPRQALMWRALAVAEAGQSGMVLLDQAAQSSMDQEAVQDQCLVLHYGEYQLSSVQESLELYLALDFDLLGRLGSFGRLTSLSQGALGVFEAPVNFAAISFTLVVSRLVVLP